MDIPDKLDPIRGFDRNYLPAWVSDFGMIAGDDEYPDGMIVMNTKRPDGGLFHVDVSPRYAQFNDTFWEGYVRPMVETLGNAIFEAEHPDTYGATIKWEVEAAMGQRDLTQEQRDIIARRNELTTWKPPFSVLPD